MAGPLEKVSWPGLVAAELGLREDQQWGYTVDGVTTIYVKDVWRLLDKDSLILRQNKAMYLKLNGSSLLDLRVKISRLLVI